LKVLKKEERSEWIEEEEVVVEREEVYIDTEELFAMGSDDPGRCEESDTETARVVNESKEGQ
jgi:hypothetical protein